MTGAVDSGNPPREVELKLRVASAALGELRESEILRRHARGPSTTRQLQSTYYDTPDHRLAARKIALRVRRIGRRFVQTLKAASEGRGAAQDRPEWEIGLVDGRPDLRSFGDPSVLERTGLILDEELVPVFTTRVRRDLVIVDWPDAKGVTTAIEVAIDEGRIEADGRTELLAEVELELKQGSSGALFELADALREKAPLAIETLDKAARGYRLAAGRVPAPVGAEPPRLDGDRPFELAMAAIFRQSLVQWMGNEAPAADGRDPEGVHQLRVALRRLRSALALFKGVLAPETRDRWNGELRWLLGSLGPARDLDVLLTELLPAVQAGTGLEDAVGALREAAVRRRASAYAELGDVLASERYADLLFGFACWIERRGWREGLDVELVLAQQESASAVAERMLGKRWHGIRKRLRHVADLDPARRHQLRVALKKLRYGVDFFAGLFDGEDARRFRKRLAGLQDVLGHMNDTTVARRLVGEAVTTLEPGKRRDAAELGGGILLGWHAGRRADLEIGVDTERLETAGGAAILERSGAMIRVLVTNIKGGCGKTTLATNLAGAFARGGLPTALADVDRQRSSLGWLSLRPADAPPIAALDWRKEALPVPAGTPRLIIDAPAALRMKEVETLIAEADIVVVPVLPSLFDETSTARFLERLEELKPIRKGRKDVLVVANRVRARSRATERLLAFLEGRAAAPTALLTDRSAYGEVAVQGLSIFDARGRTVAGLLDEWRPLLRAVEDQA